MRAEVSGTGNFKAALFGVERRNGLIKVVYYIKEYSSNFKRPR